MIPVKNYEETLKILEEKDKEIQDAIINGSLIHLQADARIHAIDTRAFKFTLKGSEVIAYTIFYSTE